MSAVLSEQLTFLLGIFAVLNPLGAIPVFLGLMAHRSTEEMRATAFKTAMAVATVLVFAVWVGESMLTFFGIGIPAFRIGGGILLLIIAIAMFDARISSARHTKDEHAEAETKEDISVVPLAIPLLAGPGAISLTIVDAHQASAWTSKAMLSGGIVLIALIIWAILWLAEPIGKRLGTTGLNIATRIMGLVLAAMAVQFMAEGLLKIFPGLAH